MVEVAVDFAPLEDLAPSEDDWGAEAPPVVWAADVGDAVVALGTAPPLSLSRPAVMVTGWRSDLNARLSSMAVLLLLTPVAESVAERKQLAMSAEEVSLQSAVRVLPCG